MNNNFFDDNISGSRLEALLSGTGLLAVIGADKRYRYVSRNWVEKTGISYEDAVGRKVADILKGSAVEEAFRRGRPVFGAMNYRTADGSAFSGFVKYIPIGSETEDYCLVYDLFRDSAEAGAFAAGLNNAELKTRKLRKQTGGSAKYVIDSILGKSSAIKELKKQILIASGINASCLIEGETGTGKELVAHSIHNHSRRSAFPFVRVNCSAIPESLMESEFFGYEEGSFTGSVKGGRAGKFETADHGSLFLDEINAMHMTMQPKLLRALQEKEIERVGGTQSVPVDVRIIAASNRPLLDLIGRNEFRQDLYYRLNILNIYIPPLREHKEDIRILAESFIEKNNEVFQQNVRGISEEALEYLESYDWPGNVRELQNAVERAMAYGTGEGLLNKEDFMKFGGFVDLYAAHSEVKIVPQDDRTSSDSGNIPEMSGGSLLLAKEAAERTAVINALKHCEGNKTKAARELGLSRTMLYKKIRKYGIEEDSI